jgi:predicted nucleic acid-binding protein
VILLDAYGLVAFLAGGPAAAEVRALLREGGVAVVGPNLTEALDVCARVFGVPVERAMEVLEPLFEGTLTLGSVDLAVARRAAELRANHDHRERRPISLADSILLAAAGRGDHIATADPDVLAVAEVEGIGVVRLPGQG